ncbi:hypothetical protein C900_04114 [Fulvivirga imtechensis AK7]|uniref:Uncharacterized protein n=1 Tax=Fulvivirga imtechensis AK7 TaxID=1237149 RepID=L8JRD3_9BACT|nr:hypothetical protein C900_04114 [Fulvivirga imtechensis AK7]
MKHEANETISKYNKNLLKDEVKSLNSRVMWMAGGNLCVGGCITWG